ncbi:outer membrane protein assembly factor [Cellulophaga baltica]|uniref:translocation and assembly module lipoprotein TamL n=1 Tax=Cellulophaga TaxID=104264 RepID=UPI001C078C4D|nr:MULTISPECIES: BamA/TamA family outer membrane protein [Cellulophaga]MBU2995047.1 outer membrane protein assembly factor [Cellulophaga baltica]MDO6766442.1 BamA/TamA family outer membrane protein [Cellulophaga sp. 1_MG-2023]
MKKNSVKIVLLFLGILITSCNALKRVEDDELFLTKNTVFTDGEKVKNDDVKSLINQKPNSAVLGYPLRLNLYNLAKVNPDSSYQAWLLKKDKRIERLTKLISKKQLDSLGESFLVKGYSKWLKKIGEPPVIIDTAKTIKSTNRIKAYYGNRGYFNATGDFSIDSSKRKQKATIAYNIKLGKPFMVDTTYSKITSNAVDSIYLAHKSNSFVKNKTQFDLTNFNNERARLTDLFKNNGIYNFQESSIYYNFISDTLAASNDQDMDVELNIENLKVRGDTTKTPYQVYKFSKINIYADHLFENKKSELDSIKFKGYTIFYKDELKYRPKALIDAIFMDKDSIYRDIDRTRTYSQINNLNVFKYPNIEITPDTINNTLESNIYLSARDKYSFGIETDITHSTLQYGGISVTPSLTARNIFGGAENLSISGTASIGASSDASIADDRFFNLLEFGGDITLDFPRIWTPLVNTKRIIPYYMFPKTRISLGSNFQTNIGLDKQTLNAVLGYSWTPKSETSHAIELLNIQYVRNLNPDRFYYVYTNTYDSLDEIADDYEDEELLADAYYTDDDGDLELSIPDGTSLFTEYVLDGTITTTDDDYDDVSSIEERRIRLTQNNLIFNTNYSFSKSNKESLTDESFYQFKFKLESAGNFLSLISNVVNFNTDEDDSKLIFGVPFSQYIKTEVDYIKHWDLSRSNVLAFRGFAGIAIPYGNSNSIPFIKSYFGGGSYDNRAWSSYSLGPGITDNVNDFNEANFKLAFNLEYRFPVAGNVKGALFADAGNIWNVFDNITDEDATFNGISSLKDVALGTGVGVRYDFTYFIFRVDLGFKTYNPANNTSDRWFTDFNFNDSVIQVGINYPF